MGQTYIWDRDPNFISDFLNFTDGFPRCAGDAVKTAEAAQWVLFYPKSVAYIGAFSGNSDIDDVIFSLQEMSLGHKIETKAKVKSSYQFVIRYGKRWSEVYIFDPKAADLSFGYINKPKVSNALERAQLIFICAFSCLQMNMSLVRLAYFTSSRFKTLCIQICRGICLEENNDMFLEILKYIDVLFVGKKKAQEMIKIFNIPCTWSTAKTNCLRIERWIKSLSKKPCNIILYDTIKTVHVATDYERDSVRTYHSKFYKASNIVDLYGCECAFSGGFLAQMIQRGEMEACVDCAFFCASAVATQMGANFPINRLELFSLWLNEFKDAEEEDKRKRNIFSSQT
ncbi:adenosine kinase [Elysia marginata]|uniref:Adenosine kinase n=1 Tax=Elysia marginata TaxID=1093978 RepID=A0AAV4HVC2_9GAST|nr:adenosine kinase [Elysia marginata]